MKNMHYEELPVNELYIAGYNRDISPEFAKYLYKNFDMRLVGTIIVSNRDGVYHIVDGQHRVQGAKAKGIKTLPCLVYENLTYQEEADLFIKYGKNRRGLLAFDYFKAEIERGDKHAIALMDAIEASGYRIAKGSGTMAIQAINVLKKIYSKDGAKMVIDVLAILRDAWNGEKDSSRGMIVQGVWHFIAVYGAGVTRQRLVNVLQKTKPNVIVGMANGDLSGKSSGTRAAMAILHLYNKNLSKKLPNRFI